jgi:hypothetical protein
MGRLSVLAPRAAPHAMCGKNDGRDAAARHFVHTRRPPPAVGCWSNRLFFSCGYMKSLCGVSGVGLPFVTRTRFRNLLREISRGLFRRGASRDYTLPKINKSASGLVRGGAGESARVPGTAHWSYREPQNSYSGRYMSAQIPRGFCMSSQSCCGDIAFCGLDKIWTGWRTAQCTESEGAGPDSPAVHGSIGDCSTRSEVISAARSSVRQSRECTADRVGGVGNRRRESQDAPRSVWAPQRDARRAKFRASLPDTRCCCLARGVQSLGLCAATFPGFRSRRAGGRKQGIPGAPHELKFPRVGAGGGHKRPLPGMHTGSFSSFQDAAVTVIAPRSKLHAIRAVAPV